VQIHFTTKTERISQLAAKAYLPDLPLVRRNATKAA
jgi:hypothetical protein